MDRVFIKDLVVSGIIGINPDERINKQDIRVNVVMSVDTSLAAASDDISDAVNYRTISKRIIAHIEQGEPLLVERLVEEIAELCLEDVGVDEVEVTVEKPGALRHTRSVGISIVRSRTQSSS